MKEAEEKQLLDYRRRVIPTREGTFTGSSARGMQGERESKGTRAFMGTAVGHGLIEY
jgi:hypothetical protein